MCLSGQRSYFPFRTFLSSGHSSISTAFRGSFCHFLSLKVLPFLWATLPCLISSSLPAVVHARMRSQRVSLRRSPPGLHTSWAPFASYTNPVTADASVIISLTRQPVLPAMFASLRMAAPRLGFGTCRRTKINCYLISAAV